MGHLGANTIGLAHSFTEQFPKYCDQGWENINSIITYLQFRLHTIERVEFWQLLLFKYFTATNIKFHWKKPNFTTRHHVRSKGHANRFGTLQTGCDVYPRRRTSRMEAVQKIAKNRCSKPEITFSRELHDSAILFVMGTRVFLRNRKNVFSLQSTKAKL